MLMVCSALMVTFGVAASAESKPLRVAVASNFRVTIEQLAQKYQARTGEELQIVSGSTGLLYQQILLGAPYDLFFAADQLRPKWIAENHLSVSPPFTYAVGRLAFWTPKTSELSLQDLREWKQPLALANPELAPYGRAAQQVIQSHLTNKDSLQRITASNVAQAMQFIASGNVPGGFVSWALLSSEQREQALLIPDEWYQPVTQDAVVLRNGSQLKAAKAFAAYVRGEGMQIIKHGGYSLPSELSGQGGKDEP